MAIFGKTDTQGQVSAGERPASPADVSSSQTVIGPKARFHGEVSGEEDVLIQGFLDGNAKVERRVTVAASGEVHGDLHGRSVVVAGRVYGQIWATERAELTASAAVEGNVNAPKVVIAEGAQLQGSVAMAAPQPAGAASNKSAEEK